MKILLQVSLQKGLTHHAQKMLHSLDLELAAVPVLKITANKFKTSNQKMEI